MNRTSYVRNHNMKAAAIWGVLACLTVLPLAGSWAAPPELPLPAPMYSFDTGSPKVINPAIPITAKDVLELGFPDPVVAIVGPKLGLIYTTDSLDAMSANFADVLLGGETFAMLFSVDRATIGVGQPDATLVALNVPYNVTDQAARGHACADQFMTTSLFSLGAEGDTAGMGSTGKNVLTRNNYDEGGVDFGGDPPTKSKEYAGAGGKDRVDAMTELRRLPIAASEFDAVYYSIENESPALDDLANLPPQLRSAANVYFTYSPALPADINLFASFENLDLAKEDDIDALIVVDAGVVGVWDAGDQVLFSLAPGSPSLAYAPSSANSPAADVYIVSYDVGPTRMLFAPANELGLGHSTDVDNVDALHFTLCDDAVACAARHGIRAIKGDMNDDGLIDEIDAPMFLECYSGEGGGILPVCGGGEYCDCYAGDFDNDDDVDCTDWHAFRAAYQGDPGLLPSFALCPASTKWTIIALAALMMGAGVFLMKRPAQATR